MKRWVVIANCQAFGMANSIQSLGREIDCDGCDLWTYRDRLREQPDYFRTTYDFAIISDEARQWEACVDDQLPRYLAIPNITFSAFHPDCCYVHVHGQALQGVVGPYHSLIALAAFQEGLSPQSAAAFFTGAVYNKVGYFDLWVPQRDRLAALFERSGLRIGPALRRLSHGESFMFTINHPKITFLFEVARLILQAKGEPAHEGSWPPPETLADTQWPIYPEVGERLGLSGGYAFKPANEHKPIDLHEFLARSHEAFAGWEGPQLVVHEEIEPRLQQIRRLMKEAV